MHDKQHEAKRQALRGLMVKYKKQEVDMKMKAKGKMGGVGQGDGQRMKKG
jgi:hypothetical protein